MGSHYWKSCYFIHHGPCGSLSPVAIYLLSRGCLHEAFPRSEISSYLSVLTSLVLKYPETLMQLYSSGDGVQLMRMQIALYFKY